MSLVSRLRRHASLARQALVISRPYFQSEDRVWAWGLLAAIVALNLGAVFMLVQINEWNRVFYDALQQREADVFWQQLWRFLWLALAYVVIAVYKFYLTQLLQLRWRRWLTDHMLARWLQGRAFYRLELARFATDGTTPDNPDQRIQEDLNLFTGATVSLGMGVFNAVLTLLSFVGILWGLSASLDVALPGALGGGHWQIPGFMVWMAVLYCLGGSLLTYWIGRPQVALNYRQQKLEADFRHHMVRVRDHAEAIAMDGGEQVEGARLSLRLRDALGNYLALVRQQKRLVWFTSVFGQAAVVFPFIVAAPRFFSGAIQLGELMQIASAFSRVQESLSWFVDNYADLAAWQATIQRLAGFEARLAAEADAPVGATVTEGPQLVVQDLDVALPDGRPLVQGASLQAGPGAPLLVSGPSGSGKSTLLRVLAGLWPYASGWVQRPPRTMFMPQRPYLPEGSLRAALAYPEPAAAYGDAALQQTLREALLPDLVERLDEEAAWNTVLSGGEQQRLAIARVLLKQPAWVMADEATSALDEAAEQQLYARLQALAQAQGGAVVSVAHRSSAQALHPRRWVLDPATQQLRTSA